MNSIYLENVALNYPIYDAGSLSLKKRLLQEIPIPVGGQIIRRKSKITSILALNEINLELVDGDRVALLGHNGAGKTSFLKLLAGFYQPTSGRISRSGNVTALINIGAGMDPKLTGYENIYIYGLLRGLTQKQIRDRFEDIATFSELGDYLDLPVLRYSQGMLLRLAFSISTCTHSDILLLDELVGAGDQTFIQKAKTRLSEMIFGSSIMVFATHNLETARLLCNKAMFLEHGRLKMFGSVDDVFSTYFETAENTTP